MVTKEDLEIGKWYRAKRYKEFFGQNNDRQILWMNDSKTKVQYDGDAVNITGVTK